MALDEAQKAYLERVMGGYSAGRLRLRERQDEAADKADEAGLPVSGPSGAFGGRGSDPVSAISEYRAANTALTALTKLERKREPTAEEAQALSAIILKENRPALLVQNNSFAVPKVGEWTLLAEHKIALEKILPAVGRIEIKTESPLGYIGTGFLVAPDVILTNRHVARFFVESKSLEIQADLNPRIDYAQEYQVERFQIAAIRQALLVDDYWDLAALQVEWDEATPKLEPLPLAGSLPQPLKDGLVTSIGYPALDTSKSERIPVQMQVFDNIFEKKRLSPGYTLGRGETTSFGKTVRAVEHDCSTLGGNSGSCLYNLDSQSVVGLHFAGFYLVANYAVPTWELTKNPVLKNLGVTFV